MSNWVLNNITAPDAYTLAATLGPGLPFPQRLNIDVINQGIYWQLQQVSSSSGISTEATWQSEVFMAPGSRSLYRDGVRAIRVRAAIPAAQLPAGINQAVVTVEAIG